MRHSLSVLRRPMRYSLSREERESSPKLKRERNTKEKEEKEENVSVVWRDRRCGVRCL